MFEWLYTGTRCSHSDDTAQKCVSLTGAATSHQTTAKGKVATYQNSAGGNPMSAQWRLGTGATYGLNHDTDFNVSWDLVWMADLPADQTKPLSDDRISGSYTSAWLQSLTGNMTFRF